MVGERYFDVTIEFRIPFSFIESLISIIEWWIDEMRIKIHLDTDNEYAR